MDDMQALAARYGGQCLSSSYAKITGKLRGGARMGHVPREGAQRHLVCCLLETGTPRRKAGGDANAGRRSRWQVPSRRMRMICSSVWRFFIEFSLPPG
ncbi:hypothetical protein [Paraburkholderia lycopersici]|nr:hypothetical protein [Paraburkholderia lycopersici]